MQAQDPGTASRSTGFTVIRRNPTLLGLLALSFGFFFLFGPVYVALPLHVSEDLGGTAGLLAGFYTAFGIGAVLGGMLTAHVSRWRLWPTTIGSNGPGHRPGRLCHVAPASG